MDKLGRPDWWDFWMTLSYYVSRKSLDPRTKHGCVVVDDDNNLLSMGYNSPPRGCDDAIMPIEPPDKYKVMAHAEENAINNAARKGISLKGSTFYVTGHPCCACLRQILNVGALYICYGQVQSHCISIEDKKIMDLMLKGQKLKITQLHKDNLHQSKIILNNVSTFVDELIEKTND